MFNYTDFIHLLISILIIFPLVMFIRSLGYLIACFLVGAKNVRITIGSGLRFKKFWIFDIRRFFHIYSWVSFDSLRRETNISYAIIYASPIIINAIIGVAVNKMINEDLLEYTVFWDRFVFYAFFYVLFDSIPMRTLSGMPNNGMIILDIIKRGRRSEMDKKGFLPSTTETERDYRDMEKSCENNTVACELDHSVEE